MWFASKIKFSFLIGVLLLGISFFIAYVFFFKKSKEYPSGQFLIYDEYSGEWQKTEKVPIYESTNNDNTNGFRNSTVFRGFFDRYDKENDLLYIKSVIPFSGRSLYEVISIKVGLQQTFYCTQSKITDEKTGETKPTYLYRFPVYDGGTLYTYFEKPLKIDDFFSKVTEETWIFLQTTKEYSSDTDNYLYKLVAVGLCE